MTTETDDTATLADLAYGIFEIVLNRELLSREDRSSSSSKAGRTSGATFRRSSPGSPKTTRSSPKPWRTGSARRMRYTNSSSPGRASPPRRPPGCTGSSRTPRRPGAGRPTTSLGGKWLIFVDPADADEAWRRVRNETAAGRLGTSARVSTAKKNPDARDDRTVIYVHTPDWRDEADVMRVRERLRELGFTERLGYKRNIETYQGEYSEMGKKVTFYSA